MICKACGQNNEGTAAYCARCGARIQDQNEGAMYQTDRVEFGSNENTINNKIKYSYIASWISAAISFIIRIAIQDRYIYWDNLLDNVKVLGIDREIKPFLTFIPAIAAIIATLMIVGDNGSDSQKKKKAWVVNIVLIALSLVFIWLDIPSEIFSF